MRLLLSLCLTIPFVAEGIDLADKFGKILVGSAFVVVDDLHKPFACFDKSCVHIGFASGSRFLGRYWNLQTFLDPYAGGKVEQGTGEGGEGRDLVFFIEACGKIITYRIFAVYDEYHFWFR